MQKKIATFLLLLASIIFALFIIEVFLRFTRPQYEYAAKSMSIENQSRIFVNPKMFKSFFYHPDTKKEHFVILNSLGFRQHREFSKNKKEGTIRIGVFGDSYTANGRMPAQYSFTEPLDYLLNKTGQKFEVLNFGVDAYGTDQIYLQYLQDGAKLDLDLVFYIYCNNDLRNIRENNLFYLDNNGELKSKEYKKTSMLTMLLRKLYITYLFMDFSNRYGVSLEKKMGFLPEKNIEGVGLLQREAIKNIKDSPKLLNWRNMFHHPEFIQIQQDFAKGITNESVKKTLDLFLKLITNFNKDCMENGARFYVATLPSPGGARMHKLLTDNAFQSLSFNEKFSTHYKGREYRFKNDGHWNEEGNKLAAIELFKSIAGSLGINYGGDEFIKHSLYEYYNSFGPNSVSDFFLKKHPEYSDSVSKHILQKYLSMHVLPDNAFTNLK